MCGFATTNDKPWVIDGVTLHAAPGERIALVGPSGSGKSTLVSLLPRTWDVTGGRVTIDGVDVRDHSLRGLATFDRCRASGYVHLQRLDPQQPRTYGRPSATHAQVVAAAEAANAHEFISRLPNGYDTLLGERGVNLSGGQRQRLSIARALLKNPRILILDEATSALDSTSEVLVQEALERAMQDRTSFIIAHRLSTVRLADRIFVLDGGRITESGSHDSLLKQNGLYAQLCRHQFQEPDVYADL